MWLEEDTGASYGPFSGNPGLNIPPSEKDPRSYFELFFDPAMYTKISSETNNYAHQRIQNLTGHLLYFYSTFTQKNIQSFHPTQIICFPLFHPYHKFTQFLLYLYSTYTLHSFYFPLNSSLLCYYLLL